MSKLPSLTARQVVRALKRGGFVEDRQKGSHLILIQPATKARTVVPITEGRSSRNPCSEASLGMRTYRRTSLSNYCRQLLDLRSKTNRGAGAVRSVTTSG